MKILITGGFGFIGSSLANKLYDEGHQVVISDYLDKFPYFRKIKYQKYFKCDLSNLEELKNLPLDDIDCICHFAGQPSAALSFANPQQDLKLNTTTTLNLIEAAKENKIKRFLYASTFNVYEEIKEKEIYKEEDPLSPKSPYANSKIASEQSIKILCQRYGISYGIMRMFNVYGPGQDPRNKSLGMINIFLTMAIESNLIEVKGSLLRFRDFIYIDDVISVWLKMIKRDDNQVVNVGTGNKSYIRDLLDAIVKAIPDKDLEIKELDGTPGDFLGAIANVDKLEHLLGFTNFISLEEGIKRYLTWAKTI